MEALKAFVLTIVADLRSRIVRLQNTVSGAAATGALTFASNPANNATIVINGITWTAKTASPSTAEYLIGATKEATAVLLAAALNASANAAISVATYEAIGAVIRITYDTKGTIGNGFTLADSSGGYITRSAATLANGANGLSQSASSTDAVGLCVTHPNGQKTYYFTTAITANSTVTAAAAGDMARTSHATGRASQFVSDGSVWQFLTNA